MAMVPAMPPVAMVPAQTPAQTSPERSARGLAEAMEFMRKHTGAWDNTGRYMHPQDRAHSTKQHKFGEAVTKIVTII